MVYREEEYARLYKQTKNPMYRDMAVEEMRDFIFTRIKAMNISGGLDDRVLKNKAIGIALKSMDTWDPARGKLTTYVGNQLLPLQRDVYKYAPILHIPENRIRDYGVFRKAYESYVNDNGDTAVDTAVLADMAGLTRDKVKMFLRENNKVFNDSVISTTDIKYKKEDHRVAVEMLATEFQRDPIKKKMWREIASSLRRNEPKINATMLADKLNIPYSIVNRKYNEMVEVINQVLTR